MEIFITTIKKERIQEYFLPYKVYFDENKTN